MGEGHYHTRDGVGEAEGGKASAFMGVEVDGLGCGGEGEAEGWRKLGDW